MNEQSKAIGRQAGLVFIEDGVYGQRWYSSRCGLDAAEYQKLVELIVAECASRVDSHLHDWLHDNSGGSMGDKLKQHFGVEQ